MTFDSYLKFNVHVKSIVTRASPRIIIFKALAGTNWRQQKETLTIQNSDLCLATGCVKMTSIDHLHEETIINLDTSLTFSIFAPNIYPELSNLITLPTV